MLWGCSDNETDFEEIKGFGLTYSEFFKTYDGLGERKNITYYKPVTIDETMSLVPDSIKKAINTINTDSLPFEVDKETAYLVTSEKEKGKIKNQVQFSYLNISEYELVEEFFIISITEAELNPLEEYTISNDFDTVGNELIKEFLIEDVPIYQQIITTDSALLYRYYDYDEVENSVITVGTTANEIYAYYNGYVYHIGYLVDREKNNEEMHENMLRLTREYILGNSL